MCLGKASGVPNQESAGLSDERPWECRECNGAVDASQRDSWMLGAQRMRTPQAGAQPTQQKEPDDWRSDE
jgi:hypothetical protein